MMKALDVQGLANTEEKEKQGSVPLSDGREASEKGEKIEAERVIRNRDVILIWEIQDIEIEVESMEGRRSWLNDRMYSTTRWVSGMPGGGSGKSGFADIMAQIAETDERYIETMKLLNRKRRKAERILKSIACQSMRTFVTMYYRDHAEKKTVMEKMRLTEWGFRRARESIESAASMAGVTWKEKMILEGQEDEKGKGKRG